VLSRFALCPIFARLAVKDERFTFLSPGYSGEKRLPYLSIIGSDPFFSA
jgi:hypothetical protein